jgi:hypothetical protein
MKAVYLYHVRKTGGTSFNRMMLDYISANCEDSYKLLLESKNHKCEYSNGVVVGWNKKELEKGGYDYGFSHIPKYNLKFKDENLIRLSIFRDPVARVVSHYKMLLGYKKDNPSHKLLEREGPFIEGGFSGFVRTLPDEHLLNQLWMFSKQYDVDEAVKNVSELDFWFMTESFNDGIEGFNKQFEFELKPKHVRKTEDIEVDDSDIKLLKGKLDKEYEFLSRISKECSHV